MTRAPAGVLVLLAALSVLPATAAAAPSAKDRYIVVLEDSADSRAVANEHARKYGVKDRLVYGSALEGYAGKIQPGQLDKIKSDPRVEYVEADGVVHTTVDQSGATWGLDRIDQRPLPLNGIYSYTNTGAGVTAYVIDTGIRTTHSEFDGLSTDRASHGAEFVDDSTTADDCDGHGTHVAGTVGGTMYGVAKGVKLVSVRVLDCSGSGLWSWVIDGIDWVTDNHVKPAVANMSLGGGANSSVDTAVTNSINAGVTYAVAAGNSGANACNYSPARVASALTMGATTSSDSRASYSNYGSCVDWFAPGSAITSADINGGSVSLSGTSMASPHTAGAAALYLQGNPGASPASVRSALAAELTTGIVTSSNSTANHLLYVGPAGVPQPFTLTTRGYKQKSTKKVDLNWSGASTSTVDIYRTSSGVTTRIATGTANDKFHTDTISTKGGGTYTYRVCHANSTTTCSNNSSVTF